MTSLPHIMVAPNGASRKKSDHQNIPVTDDEIVAAAVACQNAGADAIHFHLRDHNQIHVLDAQRCKNVIQKIESAAPGLLVQATSEAAGIYSAEEQIEFANALRPKFISIGLREIERLNNEKSLSEFYASLRTHNTWVQHILYDEADFTRFIDYQSRGIIHADEQSLLFVCGRYSQGQNSIPSDLDPFLDVVAKSGTQYDWAACAFGQGETETLVYAAQNGGKVRIGFENSIWHSDGAIAQDNAERVAVIAQALL